MICKRRMTHQLHVHRGSAVNAPVTALAVLTILLSVLSGASWCGTIYKCTDRNGATILTDDVSDGGRRCEALESFKDITEKDREAWANENKRKLSEAEAGEVRERETSREKQDRKQDEKKRDADVRGQVGGVR